MSKQILKPVYAPLWIFVYCCALIACNKGTFNEYSGTGSGEKAGTENTGNPDILYIQTNNYEKGQNAILAYKVYNEGHPTLMEEGPFLTGGSGLYGTQAAGCYESDHEVVITNDKRFLLTVNSGDNTISVFAIQPGGTLKLVPGAPFSSNGETPVSIAQWKQYFIVLNKSDNPGVPSSSAPNYSVFTLGSNGTLTPVSKMEVRWGISPGQVLASRTGPFVYGANTWGYNYTPPGSRLNLFSIAADGVLTDGPEAPAIDPQRPGALGLCQSWRQNVLYVAFPFGGRFSYYDMNTTTGALTHVGDADARPGCSRFCSDNANNRLFTANTNDNSVSMFEISNARAPRKSGELALKNSGPVYNTQHYGSSTSSACVSLATSSSDQLLYVVSQHTNPDLSIGNFNYLHVLHIVSAGLEEWDEPVELPVPNNYRARGLAVLRLN
ncbi:hypothetical protein A4H97_11335 [Niastella yeongjuensis]|uniref:Uncharacterized protein n=1 Tax=Niastella yeongjuensis TaxID=354355 RepID=A0A1V9E9I6_9BACT|nr:hypothetical protein [Niastella yeongjuensis]OQP42751.1 hypothetical protein A4H97_11335 [Niastella yeongjuensis]SEO52422.1 6-phosphogluconolactonase, cycloisomerase 2 family [Niastella yeongjuensis]